MQNERSCCECCKGGESPALEAKGWIERCDDGWRITEAGVKAWAVMSEPVTGHYGRRAWLNELYHHSGKAIQPIYLGPPAKKVFRALVRAGGTLPLAEVEALSDFHPDSRRADGLPTLMRGMYVLLQGDTVHLSVVGEIVAREMGLEVRDASG